MDKKRSKGVTIFAWLMIVLNISFFLSSTDIRFYDACFRQFPKNVVFFIVTYSMVSALIGMMAGIGLLKLRPAARKIGIFINTTDLLIGIPLFSVSFDGVKKYVSDVVVSELIKTPVVVDIEMVLTIVWDVVVVWSLAVFVLSALFIFFFTRPAVKAQFLKSGAA
ncbi:MAG: hypothetical protein PHH75_05955 [Candidatus Omnitrophica bacterium]|nr:hypothetical protein [Candidatus Omnitrophota bacterium]MDD5574706.1 hypothetical protein [Candidatus Omnitrophota bacterium]